MPVNHILIADNTKMFMPGNKSINKSIAPKETKDLKIHSQEKILCNSSNKEKLIGFNESKESNSILGENELTIKKESVSENSIICLDSVATYDRYDEITDVIENNISNQSNFIKVVNHTNVNIPPQKFDSEDKIIDTCACKSVYENRKSPVTIITSISYVYCNISSTNEHNTYLTPPPPYPIRNSFNDDNNKREMINTMNINSKKRKYENINSKLIKRQKRTSKILSKYTEGEEINKEIKADDSDILNYNEFIKNEVSCYYCKKNESCSNVLLYKKQNLCITCAKKLAEEGKIQLIDLNDYFEQENITFDISSLYKCRRLKHSRPKFHYVIYQKNSKGYRIATCCCYCRMIKKIENVIKNKKIKLEKENKKIIS